MIEFKGTQEDLSILLVSSVRYVLEKHTYTTTASFIIDCAINNKDILCKEDKKIMIKEIRKATKNSNKWDKEQWQRLIVILEEEVDGDI